MPPIESLVTHIFLFISLYTEVFLLTTFFEGRSSITLVDNRDPAEYPTTTIIVPCFNEEKTVAATVRSLLALNYPKDKLSIFVVDDGSADRTLAAVEQFRAHPSVKIFSKPNGGKYTALNFGLAHTDSELVGCLDADSFVDPNALRRIVRRFENPAVMAVTPTIKIHNPTTPLQFMQKAEYALGVFIRKVFSFLGSIYITPGPFSIFRKSVFEKIGPYRHAHNTEDLEFALRMQKNSLLIENAHDAYIYTVAPRTIRSLFKQRLRWNYGFLQNAFDYRKIFFNRSYGNLGVFVLPIAVLTFLSVIFYVTRTLIHFFSASYDAAFQASLVGTSFTASSFVPSWFFLNTDSIFILGLLLVSCTLALIFIGKWLSGSELRISRDIVYFFLFYSLLSPFWTITAIYNTLLSRQTSWR